MKDAGEDFEWYPTTQRMIDVVAAKLDPDAASIMDIGAGDGRVLKSLAKKCERAKLYAIEKSTVLLQAQPDEVIPVGTDLFEQNLTCLQVDLIFCNPPYSEFETWACAIIESGYAKRAYLIVPQRWAGSKAIERSLAKRGATAKTIHSDDFLDGERRARAIIDIVEVRFPEMEYAYHGEPRDPFDIWFDQNIDTFEREAEVEDEPVVGGIAKQSALETVSELVAAFDIEYARMEENYRAIFKLDLALLKELNVSKENVREGIKKRISGLKTEYWQLLFEQLDTITSKLCTKTKDGFLKKLTGRTAIAFTIPNVYAVVLWAIKNANKYYDEQLVTLFKDLSTFDGVLNYKSNQRTWEKSEWRFMDQKPTHYALDYRFVVRKYRAIMADKWDSPGGLDKTCHEMIDDVIAVLGNLGFSAYAEVPSRRRSWGSNKWQDWTCKDGSTLFQVKAFINGNLHFRFKPDAIRALNVEAGRLMGWIRTPSDVVDQLGYTPAEAAQFFRSSHQLTGSSVKLLAFTEVGNVA